MWSKAAGVIEGLYVVWMAYRDHMEARAKEEGKQPGELFADLLVKGLKERLGGKDEPEEVR